MCARNALLSVLAVLLVQHSDRSIVCRSKVGGRTGNRVCGIIHVGRGVFFATTTPDIVSARFIGSRPSRSRLIERTCSRNDENKPPRHGFPALVFSTCVRRRTTLSISFCSDRGQVRYRTRGTHSRSGVKNRRRCTQYYYVGNASALRGVLSTDGRVGDHPGETLMDTIRRPTIKIYVPYRISITKPRRKRTRSIAPLRFFRRRFCR